MLFPVQVAERIIATPLIGSVYVDKMVWEEERNGCYSVKSGYKLAMKCIFRNDKYHVKGNWKEIWKVHAPQKARHLLWRLCRGCIPTRRRLLERHVDCDVHCPLCEDEVEDDVHAFFTCASAQSSWQAAGLSSVLGSAACQQGSAADRVFAVCRNEDYATIGRVAMLLWSIWQNRNDKIWNDNLRSPIQVGRAAFDQWNEWIAVHKLRSNDDQDDPPVSTIRWEKPRIGWLKCNVDAAFFVSAGRTAMGACFRNNSGEFMAGITQWQQMTLSTDEGEAWALLQAMNEAKSREFAKFRQRYLDMYCPFGKKSTTQKMKEWFNTILKIKKENKVDTKDKNLLKESKNKSSLLSFSHSSENAMRSNKNAHHQLWIRFVMCS
ncbi:uncharacterized protein LOC123904158 [Trifolium pratense]|uniref:uncharacterized protein LOC123904158 n=1 Tax=Trifolium pratense TaxID=57577 RepID=UPI001E690BD0|nr:uncharacterized protein LOC123904158 [Trifolium pratense]